MNAIPTRHSPKAVDRYAPFIESVCANYPRPIVIDPSPLSPDTFACRFRDAVAGILRYGSAPYLYEAVQLWASDYIVASIKGTNQLAIGKTSHVKEAIKVENGVGRIVDANIAPIQTVDSPSERILNAILILMEAHILEHATLTGVDEKAVHAMLPKFSRQIEVINSNGTITLL